MHFQRIRIHDWWSIFLNWAKDCIKQEEDTPARSPTDGGTIWQQGREKWYTRSYNFLLPPRRQRHWMMSLYARKTMVPFAIQILSVCRQNSKLFSCSEKRTKVHFANFMHCSLGHTMGECVWVTTFKPQEHKRRCHTQHSPSLLPLHGLKPIT